MNAAVTFNNAAAGHLARSSPVARTAHAGPARKRVKDERKTRIQFDVSSASMERLSRLKAKIEATSYAEVVKNALRLYEALIDETEKGSRFLVEDADGKTGPFKMFVS